MQEFTVKDGEVFKLNGVSLIKLGNNIMRVDIKDNTPSIGNVTSKETITGDRRDVEIRIPTLKLFGKIKEN